MPYGHGGGGPIYTTHKDVTEMIDEALQRQEVKMEIKSQTGTSGDNADNMLKEVESIFSETKADTVLFAKLSDGSINMRLTKGMHRSEGNFQHMERQHRARGVRELVNGFLRYLSIR